jgi:hypothetical protein
MQNVSELLNGWGVGRSCYPDSFLVIPSVIPRATEESQNVGVTGNILPERYQE